MLPLADSWHFQGFSCNKYTVQKYTITVTVLILYSREEANAVTGKYHPVKRASIFWLHSYSCEIVFLMSFHDNNLNI